MVDIIKKYLASSKDNLYNISIYLEENIEFLENKLWTSNEEFRSISKDIINIYYDKYYLYPENDFNIINKYIKFNNNINRKLKQFLLAIIEYYENNNKQSIIKQEEASILYITILLFTSETIYNTLFSEINIPKKIEKRINNIIDNFAKIRFNKNKDLEKLILNIQKYVELNNNFNKILNQFSNTSSYNSYICINKNSNIYKILYEYDINELDKFDGKDIGIVRNKDNIPNKLITISYDISLCTMYKLLSHGKNYKLLFPITKEYIETLPTITDNFINKNIKYIIDYGDIKNDYNLINQIKIKNLDLFIEINNVFESDNYNMFMNIKNIIIPEDFLTKNEKYVEIWKDMGINFIIKDLGKKLNEKEIIESER